LTTNMSVIDICFEAGYNSLGTFTRRFTDIVGSPPQHFRHMAARVAELPPQRVPVAADCSGEITGVVQGPKAESRAVVCVGMFPTPIPQGRPVDCTILDGPGPFSMRSGRDGIFYFSAAMILLSASDIRQMLNDPVLTGRSEAVRIHDGRTVGGPVKLTLRPSRLTDPPILVPLGALIAAGRHPQAAAVAGGQAAANGTA